MTRFTWMKLWPLLAIKNIDSTKPSQPQSFECLNARCKPPTVFACTLLMTDHRFSWTLGTIPCSLPLIQCIYVPHCSSTTDPEGSGNETAPTTAAGPAKKGSGGFSAVVAAAAFRSGAAEAGSGDESNANRPESARSWGIRDVLSRKTSL